MDEDSNVVRYWKQYLASLPPRLQRASRGPQTASFGISEDEAREIAPLVKDGTKTASGALVWSTEFDGKREIQPGDLWVVVAGPDEPVCVIESIEVLVFPYEDVPEAYAWEGGEGDRTMGSWRRIYWNYIVSECKRIGRNPDTKAPLAMERFRVVFSEPYD
jgi:uncharacterized protein YhfF